MSAEKLKGLVWSVVRAFLLIGMCFVILYPLLRMLSMTFRLSNDMHDLSVVWIPKHYTFDNLTMAIKILKYDKALTKTITIAFVSTMLQLVSCSMAGYGFARYKFKESGLLFALVIFTMVVPPQTSIISLYVDMRYFDFLGIGSVIGLLTGRPFTVNLLNSGWVFYVPAAFASGIRAGFFIFIFRQFFKSMPKDLENAAKVDGSGVLRTFIRIMVPNAMPAFITVFLFSFVWYWNDYAISSMLLQLKGNMINPMLKSMVDILTMNYSIRDFSQIYVVLSAGAFLTILPVLIVYAVGQKFFIESAAIAGLKE